MRVLNCAAVQVFLCLHALVRIAAAAHCPAHDLACCCEPCCSDRCTEALHMQRNYDDINMGISTVRSCC
jgi:hypothetical protein